MSAPENPSPPTLTLQLPTPASEYVLTRAENQVESVAMAEADAGVPGLWTLLRRLEAAGDSMEEAQAVKDLRQVVRAVLAPRLEPEACGARPDLGGSYTAVDAEPAGSYTVTGITRGVPHAEK
jgi:hypothetical protein